MRKPGYHGPEPMGDRRAPRGLIGGRGVPSLPAERMGIHPHAQE